MNVPDKAKLAELRNTGDKEVDDLVVQFASDHGYGALAGLLNLLFRWTPDDPFPPESSASPLLLIAAANEFLHKPGVLAGAVPGGIDWKSIDRAQQFYTRYQSSGLLILGCGSLPACYSIPGIARVLMGSGRLSMQVTRRLTETIAFLTEVMKPGSLGPGDGAIGVVWIRKVRLMHALMRRMMLADATGFGHLVEDTPANFFLKLDWTVQRESGDSPIDQLELGFVLLTFSWMVVNGFGHLGIRMNEEQRNDHIYTWAVIGHGLGMDEVLRPRDAATASALFDLIRSEYEEGTEQGRLLVAALLVYIIFRQREAIRERLPQPRPVLLRWFIRQCKPFWAGCLESLARTFVRDLTGVDTANKLWVPRAPFTHWVVGKLLRALITLLEMRQAGDWNPAKIGKGREKGLPRILGDRLKAR